MGAKNDNVFVDYYKLLGISPTSNSSEIRNAYLQQAQEHHPDAGGSTAMMEHLNAAYTCLKSTTGKAAYDTVHSLRAETSTHNYKYDGGRHAKDVDDMSDSEIDEFLDTMLAEFRHGVPEAKKAPVKERIKKMFEM
ncbi:DnaJ domain-containing protein [Aeromicrobium sp.]|nr:DnaJ domain-containing protein [Candidatus Saccharibacteria bacterium]